MEFFVPILVLLGLTLIICVGILVLSHLLGPKVFYSAKKLTTYECGVQASADGDARHPFSIKFYRVAVLFLLFDIEAAFFFPWALVYKDTLATGPFLLFVLIAYLFFMVLGFWYVIRKGALEFD